MVYADYGYYQTEFLGTSLTAADFDRCATRASSFIDYYTLGKAEKKAELPAVKMCCCALADQYYKILTVQAQSADGKELKSQTVGSWTKTYSSSTELEASARARLAEIAREYLANTGLLYRGGHGCVSSCC